MARGLVSAADEALAGAHLGTGHLAKPPAAGVHPAALDWRNRFGGNWITTVRDQNPCNACWAFAGTALVESMLKIEHERTAPSSKPSASQVSKL